MLGLNKRSIFFPEVVLFVLKRKYIYAVISSVIPEKTQIFVLKTIQNKYCYMRKSLLQIIFGFLLVIVGPQISFAQTAICGFDHIFQQQMKKPGFAERVNKMNEAIQKKQVEMQKLRELSKNANFVGGVPEIPVVVHVIEDGGNTVVSDANIYAMMATLNSKFASNSGVAIPMTFKLAARAPGCGYTTGIVRINGSGVPGYSLYGISYAGAQGASEADIMALSKWPVKQYYNIWVVKTINATGLGSGQYIGGWAYVPSSEIDGDYINGTPDGMILNSVVVNGTNSTAAHEMGHAMALFHTFEGGDANTCPSGNGDWVTDTEPIKNLLGVSLPDSSQTNPCTGFNYNNTQYNFMGYGSPLNRFTVGQSNRAMAALNAVRGGLSTSLGSVAPPSNPVTTSNDPPQPIANPTNGGNVGPCSVMLNDLVYHSRGYNIDGNEYYLDNSCNIGTTLVSTQPYTLQVTTETNFQRCKVWIDFDGNGTLDPVNELVGTSVSSSASHTHSFNITTAMMSGAAKGTLIRMRIMADFMGSGGAPANFGPATQLGYGQTEDFWLNITNGLPVTFDNVTAIIKNNTLNLNWTTLTEKNNDYFIIEASADGNEFKKIGEVRSAAVEGNSDQPMSYHFSVDAKGLAGVLALGVLGFGLLLVIKKKRFGLWINLMLVAGLITWVGISCDKASDEIKATKNEKMYIRIVQVDKDGTKTYSKVLQAISE